MYKKYLIVLTLFLLVLFFSIWRIYPEVESFQSINLKTKVPEDVAREPTERRHKIIPVRRSIIREKMQAYNPKKYYPFPLTSFNTKNHQIKLEYRGIDSHSRLLVDNDHIIEFQRPGVPLDVLQVELGHIVIIFKEIFSNSLYVYDVSVAKGILSETLINASGEMNLLFRAAELHQDKLMVALYDNVKGFNYLHKLELREDGYEQVLEPVQLPSVKDPAGTHYEMIPTMQMKSIGSDLYIHSGMLSARYKKGKIELFGNLDGCWRLLEQVYTSDGWVVLCSLKSPYKNGSFKIFNITSSKIYNYDPQKGVPWNLSLSDEGAIEWEYMNTPNATRAQFVRDIQFAKSDGILNFGSSNLEGRVAWSQVYYLNGFLDILYLAQRDDQMYEIFAPLVEKIKLRLDIEIYALNNMLKEVGYATRAFSVDRKLGIFAVQSSRLLMLFTRYLAEVENPVNLGAYAGFKERVLSLGGHLEVVDQSKNETNWLRQGQYYLKWPKGNIFYFDGLNVPFNHQNEWANAIFEAWNDSDTTSPTKGTLAIDVAKDVVKIFWSSEALSKSFPNSGVWKYWWGQAHEGWTEDEYVSVNTPSYPGDKSDAWISFKSIDVMAVLSAKNYLPEVITDELLASAEKLVTDGKVYPLVARSLVQYQRFPSIEQNIASAYARLNSPWEISNLPWAYLNLKLTPQPEDPHSNRLNERIKDTYNDIARKTPFDVNADEFLYQYLQISIPFNTNKAMHYRGHELGGKYLAWNLAYDLRAAIIAYEKTKQSRFLDLFDKSYALVLSMRDNELGIKDDIRGRILKGWGTNRYSKDKKKWVVWDAFAGMLLYPSIKYAKLVSQYSPGINYETKALLYREVADQVFSEFDETWRREDDQAGYYFDPYYNDVAPLNHMNALGRAHVEMYLLTGSEHHRRRAEGLARYWKKHMRLNEKNDAYEWDYWPRKDYLARDSRTVEDVTHAQINIHFAILCHQAGIVFDDRDMRRFSRTLTKQIVKEYGEWAGSVNGKYKLIEDGLHEGIQGWIVLKDYDSKIPELISKLTRDNPQAFPLGWLSYATGPIAYASML